MSAIIKRVDCIISFLCPLIDDTDLPSVSVLRGRFLELRIYHNFAILFSKLSESTFYKEISKVQ